MMFSLFLYAEDIYGAGEEAGLMWMRTFYRIISVVLATPVMILCGAPLAKHAWKRLMAGHLSMSALIAVGAFASYGLSVWAVFTGGTDVYLDSASTSLVLATLGRYLEATARSKASGLISPSVDAGGKLVRVLDPATQQVRELVPASKIQPGDLIDVDPEQVVPVDVRLVGHAVDVDLGVLTGESSPVTVHEGEVVASGAVPVSGSLRGEALRIARESTVERLSELAKGLREKPSFLMRVADAFARWLTPLVWLLALGTFGYWTWAIGVERGIINALAVVLVACPCSYAIATPLVHWLAMRRAVKSGVLVRNAEVLERLTTLDTVAFDKTGTLTHANLEVTGMDVVPGHVEAEVRAIVRAMEAQSPHPVARALFTFAGEVTPAELASRRFEPGRGVSAIDLAGRALALGPSGRVAGGAPGDVALTRDDVVIATFTLAERLKPEAPKALGLLTQMGVRVKVLTGDAKGKAEKIAGALGVPFDSELSPEAKVKHIAGLGAASAMVGDGLNDAPALAGTTSFATAGATGLSRGLAQVNLLKDDLLLVPFTIQLARRATQLILRLLVASTLYNLVFLVLAVSGTLRPVWAGLSMLIASLLTLAMASSVSTWPDLAEEEPR
ncbi:HAD-IC family P-type ATPase [Myxococcota bacterium]|nr:HAD-IC family P-type ATPase [Myxococcota bacterium]